MPFNKRKREIFEAFDPNKSDPEDENFDPSESRPRRVAKKSRSSKPKGSRGRKRAARYRGSDIDDDDDVSDSEQDSFGEEDDQDDEEEAGDDEEDLVNATTGRRRRKAATNHAPYKEDSSDDQDSVVADSNPEPEPAAPKESKRRAAEEAKQPAAEENKLRRIVVLKTNLKSGQGKGGKEAHSNTTMPTRRSTRARTEERDEQFLELSNSGRHARPARASKSKSPEAAVRSTRATRAAKGLKKPPAPIQEATQESEPQVEVENTLEIAEEDEHAETVQKERPKEEEGGEGASVRGDVVQDSSQQMEEDAPGDEEQPVVAEDAGAMAADEDEEEEDQGPITRRARSARNTAATATAPAPAAAEEAEEAEEADEDEPGNHGPRRRLARKAKAAKKSTQEPSSDFEPHESGDGDDSGSGDSDKNDAKEAEENEDESSNTSLRRGRSAQTRSAGARKTRRNQDSGDEEIELDRNEMAEELQELRESSRSRPRRTRQSPSIQYEASKRRRTAKPVNYSIPAIDPAALEEPEDEEPAATPSRNRRGGKSGANQAWERTLNTTYGPFGGGGAGSILGGPWGTGAAGGVETDSSDDEMIQRSGIGGTIGMTPTSAAPPLGLFGVPAQTHNADGLGGAGGPAPNVGKIKNQKAFADADPLGVDMSVDFTKVGGLHGHIDQLKEMVQLPLLYPELFSRFHVTPPRGVLFHGPPGTGKTLLARALANSIGSGGRKITFYMRKGADALSKWVGEAEKQLRLLFEEARRTQPSIIFFDEIDGLAPVRSSKQEQIHASIVSTLLALMDGMDGRGQVIVIGATNRPDNIDPALRRPGRFDREFYFPLPDVGGRRAIIDIHTKDWGLGDEFKDRLAENTKGYAGADLRALCTEAALNAIQRTYPQIYSSKEKLVVNPDKISIHATDFTISMKKMIPSSQRSASSAATPLPKSIEPLLRGQFKAAARLLDDVFPRKKKITALEEAMFEPYDDHDHGFGREAMQQEFERSRIFRPRLLLSGLSGMGQHYLAAALLHYLEGVHVQNFDLAALLGDGRPIEQVIVGFFTEVKRHKPSVIYIPSIEGWWANLNGAATTTFITMLRSIPPTDPILVLATAECLPEDLPQELLNEVFGFSKKNRTVAARPNQENRWEFFKSTIENLRKSPRDFPDPAHRKKRVLEELPVAPPPPPKSLTRAEIKAQRKADLHHLNLLKIRLQPVMDQIHRKYRKFRNPVIPFSSISYLFDESDPNFVRPDVSEGAESRPYEIAKDKDGTDGIRDVATGKFYYNLETTTIEERLANGYYARPIDFYNDINKLYLDAKNIGDRERTLKSNELRTNVEVDVHDIEQTLANQGIRFQEIYERQMQRAKELEERAAKRRAMQSVVDMVQSDVMGDADSDSQGPVGMGFSGYAKAGTTGARFRVRSPLPHKPGNGDTSGSHPLTNGSTVPSGQEGEDVQMRDAEDESMGPPSSQWFKMPPRPLRDSARATAGTTQLSQVSAITSLPPGVSPSAILNDASTTKTSEPSTHRGSGSWNTNQTNGLHSNAEDASQLVDTQPQTGGTYGPSQSSSSSRDWAHSQAQGLAQGILQPRMSGALFSGERNENTSPSGSQPRKSSTNVTSLGNILNDEAPNNSSSIRNSSSSNGSSQQLVIHEGEINDFHHELVDGTSGCTVEQLEQINRELMEELWRTRHEWNRVQVKLLLTTVFNDTMRDIDLMQGQLAQSTQEDEKEDERYIYLR